MNVRILSVSVNYSNKIGFSFGTNNAGFFYSKTVTYTIEVSFLCNASYNKLCSYTTYVYFIDELNACGFHIRNII